MSSTERFKVGDWLVEPKLDRISRGSESKNLRPKVMDVLVYLADRRGQVVSADEFLDDLWSGKIVTDASVYRCVGELREALAGGEDGQAYIDTIPKKGYRLIAPVDGLGEDPERADEKRKFRWVFATAAAILPIAALVIWTSIRLTSEPPAEKVDSKSIAVLPFENLSADPDDLYITDGFHNDLLTQLTKIGGLKVISRVSVLQYRDSPKNSKEIGRELGVATILEGAVQRAGDSLRMNVQLIDANTDTHLWAEVYDSEFSVESILSVQQDMTVSIASALQAALSPDETARISEIPTKNTRAYDFYLSGNEYFARQDRRKFVPIAVQQFQRAVDEDPWFAVAWAALARAHTAMYFDRFLDPTESRLQTAKEALDRAFALAPDSSQAHFASGAYQYAIGDYETALTEFSDAEQGLPGDAQIYHWRAMLLERSGRWEESIESRIRAVQLDPRNIGILWTLANTYQNGREYANAERTYGRILEIRPDLGDAYFAIAAIIPLLRDGNFEAVKSALADPRSENINPEFRYHFGWFGAIYERDYETALDQIRDRPTDEHGRIGGYLYKESLFGMTYELAGRRDLAERNFEVALTLIEAAIRDVETRPPEAIPEEHAILSIQLAEALMGLGREEEAILMVQQALELMPAGRDAIWNSILREEAIAKVLVKMQNRDAALTHLEIYFSAPGRWSVDGLLADPRFDPIRQDPRIVALVEKYKRS